MRTSKRREETRREETPATIENTLKYTTNDLGSGEVCRTHDVGKVDGPGKQHSGGAHEEEGLGRDGPWVREGLLAPVRAKRAERMEAHLLIT